MRIYPSLLFAGALLASTSFASQADPFREQRMGAKIGRYTIAKQVPSEECGGACCRHKHAASQPAGNAESARLERWFQAKSGRTRTIEPQPAAFANPAPWSPQAFLDGWALAKSGRTPERAADTSAVASAQPSTGMCNSNCCE